jgi:hypothetical protein
MENEQKKLVLLASEVTIAEEDEKLNPVFLSIEMKLADSAGNRNNQGITAAFISDLINRQEEFECLPFYADVKNLLARNYDNLGHMYNKVTKKFSSTQIGSLTNFYSETDNDGVISLYATARVPKREKDICIRLAELYELEKLNVSFEVRYNPEYTIEKDGVLYIDANEENALTGIALVSVPACPDATALDMVASVADDSEEIVAESEEQAERGEIDPMKENELITAEEKEVTTQEEVVAEAEAEQISAEDVQAAVAESEVAEASDEGTSESGENTVVAEQEEANAEVLEHSVDTHESVEDWGGGPVHVFEYRERVIETMDDAEALVAELDAKITELEEIKSKYDAIVVAEQEKVLAEKRANAKAFAEKQGLNIRDVAVAEAIEKLDYEKIAELSMAEEQEPEEVKPEKQEITLASFVDMEVSNDKYGGLLSRKTK